MDRENRLARLFRALTSDTQTEFAQRTGLHPSTIAHYESGDEKPGLGNLEIMAAGAGITVADGDEILRLYGTLRMPRLRPGRGVEELCAELGEEMRTIAKRTYERILRMPLPASPPTPEDRRLAEEQIAVLRELSEEVRSAVVRSSREYQTLALADRAAEEALEAAERNPDEAAGWARLAQEIADDLDAPVASQANEVRAHLRHVKARIATVLGQPEKAHRR